MSLLTSKSTMVSLPEPSAKKKVSAPVVAAGYMINAQDSHDGASPRCDVARCGAARQRSEQYFTFAQSRAHFFRQTKGRLQTTQGLVGSSSLRRVRATRSPGHRLAAPVEEPAIGVRRKLIDDSEQMSGRRRRRVNLQAGGGKGS